MGKRKAFVTGGTGFVGINLIRELVKQDWDVTALHRPSSDLSYIQNLGVSFVEGSILDPKTLVTGMPDGVDTVFHVAGNTSQWKAQNDEQTLDNVDGTRNVVDAAVTKKARRLIVTSSVAAYGLHTGEFKEDMTSNADTSWVNYQKSKYLGELEGKKGMAQGLEVVTMNPGAIIGPYDLGTWSRMFTMLNAGGMPGCPPGRATFTHVSEVVNAHIAAADKGENGGNYILGGTNTSFFEMIDIMCKLLGKTTPKVMPAFVFGLVAWMQGIGAAFTGKEPQMTPEMNFLLTKDMFAHSEKAQNDLGYQCRPMQEMIEDCYNWMVKDGRI